MCLLTSLDGGASVPGEWEKFHRKLSFTPCAHYAHCAVLGFGWQKSHTSKRQRARSSESFYHRPSRSLAHVQGIMAPEKKRNKENGNSQTAIKKMNGMRTWYIAGLYTFVNVMSYVALLWNFHFISWPFLFFFSRRIYFYSCHMVTNLLCLIRNSSPLSGEVPLDIRYGFFYISIVPFKHASTQTFIHKKSYATVEGLWSGKLSLSDLNQFKIFSRMVSLRERQNMKTLLSMIHAASASIIPRNSLD